MARKLSLWLYTLLLLWMGAGVVCLYIPPHVFWLAGFVSYSLPLALLLNVAFLVLWLFRLSWKAVLPLAVTIAFFDLYSRSLKLSFSDFDWQTTEQGFFSILSYNVMAFRIDPEITNRKERKRLAQEFFDYLKNHPADVICLQEYYNSEKWVKSTTELKKTRPYYFVSVGHKDKFKDQYGIAVFSKYPIINKGVIPFGKLKANHAMFADVVLPEDTFRIYSFHLQSMKIKSEHIPELNDNETELKSKGSTLYQRLKKGFIDRGSQVQILREHIETSPYPVIAAGDLNDLPHSYTYHHLRRVLHNAFEEAGSGTGTSFADFLPFIRIDNHFISKNIQAHQFETLDTIRFSDHYPVVGLYSVEE